MRGRSSPHLCTFGVHHILALMSNQRRSRLVHRYTCQLHMPSCHCSLQSQPSQAAVLALKAPYPTWAAKSMLTHPCLDLPSRRCLLHAQVAEATIESLVQGQPEPPMCASLAYPRTSSQSRASHALGMSQQQTRGASARAVVVGNAKSGYGLHKSGDKLVKSSSSDLNAEAMTCPKNTSAGRKGYKGEEKRDPHRRGPCRVK
jgi:hypothetical protein